MTSGQWAKNRGLATIYNGFGNVNLLAEAAKPYSSKPYFGLTRVSEGQVIKVPGVYAGDCRDGRLYVSCDCGPSSDDWYSSGVRAEGAEKLAKPVRVKK